jgi:hypothetical protein
LQQAGVACRREGALNGGLCRKAHLSWCCSSF